MPICPKCGSQQPHSTVFCDKCGAKLGESARPSAACSQPASIATATTCPACGASTMPDWAFCDQCGTAFSPAVPTPAPANPLVCSSCGALLSPSSKFCEICGAVAGGVGQGVESSAPASIPAPTMPSLAQASSAGHAAPTARPSGSGMRARLVVQGSDAVLSFPPDMSEVIIGRKDPVHGVFPDIDLTDHGGGEEGVSRQHARTFFQGSQIFIEDLHSTNHTYVNQQELTPGQPHPLQNGDEVRLGRLKFNFYRA